MLSVLHRCAGFSVTTHTLILGQPAGPRGTLLSVELTNKMASLGEAVWRVWIGVSGTFTLAPSSPGFLTTSRVSHLGRGPRHSSSDLTPKLCTTSGGTALPNTTSPTSSWVPTQIGHTSLSLAPQVALERHTWLPWMTCSSCLRASSVCWAPSHPSSHHNLLPGTKRPSCGGSRRPRAALQEPHSQPWAAGGHGTGPGRASAPRRALGGIGGLPAS